MAREVPTSRQIGVERRPCAGAGNFAAVRHVEAQAPTNHQALPVVCPEVVLWVDGCHALAVIAVAGGCAEADVERLKAYRSE